MVILTEDMVVETFTEMGNKFAFGASDAYFEMTVRSGDIWVVLILEIFLIREYLIENKCLYSGL